jgi:hypothetical protein
MADREGIAWHFILWIVDMEQLRETLRKMLTNYGRNKLAMNRKYKPITIASADGEISVLDELVRLLRVNRSRAVHLAVRMALRKAKNGENLFE